LSFGKRKKSHRLRSGKYGTSEPLEYSFSQNFFHGDGSVDREQSSCSIQVSVCPIPWSKCHRQFGDSNSTHYWSFWLSNIVQTSRESSCLSHFLPLLTCKVIQDEVHLP
jgi:hypothetical protein